MYNDELYHYGVKGMHWGIRRYQDANGHLTIAGQIRRYGKPIDINNLDYNKLIKLVDSGEDFILNKKMFYIDQQQMQKK